VYNELVALGVVLHFCCKFEGIKRGRRVDGDLHVVMEEFASFPAGHTFTCENGTTVFHKCFLHPISDCRRDITANATH